VRAALVLPHRENNLEKSFYEIAVIKLMGIFDYPPEKVMQDTAKAGLCYRVCASTKNRCVGSQS
jgi:hypothetical protein